MKEPKKGENYQRKTISRHLQKQIYNNNASYAIPFIFPAQKIDFHRFSILGNLSIVLLSKNFANPEEFYQINWNDLACPTESFKYRKKN